MPLKNADGFNQPFQELVTEYCRGVRRSRDELPRKTRSMRRELSHSA
jgi:4-carboxymuconolactone decarboxylase